MSPDGVRAASPEPAAVRGRIGDRWVDPDGARIESYDPADRARVVAVAPAMSRDDAGRAVGAAVDAYAGWASATIGERAGVVRRAAALLAERGNTIITDIVAESGKTVTEATGEVTRAAEILDYYAAMGFGDLGTILADRRPNVSTWVQRKPLGAVIAITPWNDPLLTPVRKLAPSLVFGNTVVLKCAEQTPMAAAHLVRALVDAGAPAGSINLVTGTGEETGAGLVADERIAAITFTGSTATGRGIQRATAGRGVRVQAEMGGKNAIVVTDEADLDLAEQAVRIAGFGQAGQRCSATSRVITLPGVHHQVVDRLVALAERLVVGPGIAPTTDVGPVIDEASVERIVAAVDGAVGSGAKLAAGGHRVTAGELAAGCFVAPTVLTDVDAANPVWRTELFGPVVAIGRALSLDHAIELVDDTAYGLTASIFTSRLADAKRFVRSVDVGNVAVNLPTVGWDVNVPFGGMKDSGSGYREQGTEAVVFCTRTMTVAMGEAGFA